MNRKDFIIKCGFCSIGLITGTAILSSCTPTKYLQVPLRDSGLKVAIKEFEYEKKGVVELHSYIVLHNPQLQYPVALFRRENNQYSALLMRCTHQGTELNVYGDRLQCPAHGSEFTHQGNVQNGPADEQLRKFPVTVVGNHLTINLS